MWVTSRDEAKREAALELGAHEAFETGARLPERVDAVLETVGEATWKHSLRSLKPGGVLVVSGATSGQAPSAELQRLFFLQLRVVGSTMGTRSELVQLVRLLDLSGVRPRVDRVLPLAEARDGLAALAERRRGREDRPHPVSGAAARSSARGTSRQVIGPSTTRSVAPGRRSARPARSVGAGRPNSRQPNSAARWRSAAPASARARRQPEATSVAPCHSSQRQRRNGSRPGGSAYSA